MLQEKLDLRPERADPITLPFISPESKFDPGNLIGRLKKRFLNGLLLVKCAMILAKPVLLSVKTKDCGCQSKEIGVGMEVRLLSVGARGFFLAASRLGFAAQFCRP